MNILKNITFTILMSSAIVYSLNLNELKHMPKSVERDFYIWQYLKKSSTTKTEAIEASKLIDNLNSKLNRAFYKKSGYYLKKRVKRVSHIINSNRYTFLISKLHKSGSFYESWLKLSNHDKLALFSLAGKENRRVLNRKISKQLYNNLQRDKLINQVIFRAFRENLDNLKYVILNYPPTMNTHITYNNLCKLGFKNLRVGKNILASKFFNIARFKASSKFYSDRATFWAYMSSKNRKYLISLANSHDFNIYRLIALDKLGKPYPRPNSAKLINKISPINIQDPISWARLKQKIFSNRYNLYQLALKYNSTVSQAYYFYILNKASKDTKHYFPMPYRDIISKYPIDRQALIYAIAKQESQFIPAAISRSFAVGMMQFMPFLVKHIAKVRRESVRLEDMFNPKIAIKFANTHLNYLNKYLYHPLFVAYAYNAGIGYTKRLIRKNIFKSGAYEPYISLERVDKQETNYYGKKVLANYIIYKNLLGSPIRATTLLNRLDKPYLTDRFR